MKFLNFAVFLSVFAAKIDEHTQSQFLYYSYNIFIINISNITKQTAGFSGSDKVFVLDSDINFSGYQFYAVGRHATGFQGSLFGNKHSLSNGSVIYESWVDSTSHYAVGLFHKINKGKVYDLTIESNIKFTMKTDVPINKWVYMGGLSAWSVNGYFVNVNSKVNIDVRQTTAAVGSQFAFPRIGGIIGYNSGTLTMYKCSFSGTIYYKTGSNSIVSNNGSSIGGLIGQSSGAGNHIIDSCSSSGTITFENNSVVTGGIIGNQPGSNGTVLKITNCIIGIKIKMVTPFYVKDVGLITGESAAQSKATIEATAGQTYSATISNIYITGRIYTSATDTTGYVGVEGTENNGSVANQQAIYSNIFTPLASTETVQPTNVNSANKVTKSGSVSAVVSKANSNANITNNFSVSSSGAVSTKLDNSFRVHFVKGNGATGGPADTTFSFSASVQNKTNTPSPSRSGYSFSGWSLLSPSGALSNSTKTTYSIPAGKRGNIRKIALKN